MKFEVRNFGSEHSQRILEEKNGPNLGNQESLASGSQKKSGKERENIATTSIA